MIKYEKNNKNLKIFTVTILLILIVSIMTNGIGKIETNKEYIFSDEEKFLNLRDGANFIWEDDFFDESKINASLSYNYNIDTDDGVIYMDNTYSSWAAYPQWQKMKPIEITNSGTEVFYNYVIEINVAYDGDMQADFDDLRFADEQGFPIVYWIGERTVDSAKVLVRIPELEPMNVTKIFMFYKNPSANDESDENIFTLEEITDEDVRVSYTSSLEGVWDPDVQYGSNKFFVAWEEGEGPEYDPTYTHRLIQRQIHARLYDTNGENPIPDYPEDIDVSTVSSPHYHAENPSVAYSEDSDRFFVVWDENPTTNKWQISIRGARVRPDGFDYGPITICEPSYQFPQYYPCVDPCVAYDKQSNRFMVVWAKADTNWDYDLYAKYYDYNGNQVGSQITIASDGYYQGQPWICSDNQGHFLVVYERGTDSENGPFDLRARLYDHEGNQIGSTIVIVEGTSGEDNIYPAVEYNEITGKYLIAWNTGDTSDGDYTGAIKGKILDENGGIVTDVEIQGGIVYKIASVKPYLGSMFFVAFDDDSGNYNKIWGRLVTSEGVIMGDRLELSDDIECSRDFVNLGVGEGKIMAAWEDDRIEIHLPETRVSVWQSPQTTSSDNVSFIFGEEKSRILESVIVSKKISPEDFVEWNKFTAFYAESPGTFIKFDILDENASEILIEDISSGESMLSIIDSTITLKATFTRSVPTNTSILDLWRVNATIGSDIEPPWTEAEFSPEQPNGENGWYTSPIQVNLTAYDNDSPPENVSTYYIINDGDLEEYNLGPINISFEGLNNSLEFWSEDTAENEEIPHNFVDNLNIDLTSPFVTINEPQDYVNPGVVTINGTASEYGSGSGLSEIIIRINDEIVFNESYTDTYFSWFDYSFSVSYGETYTIKVEAYDQAGLKGEDRKEITCSDKGIYEPGYIYLFDNPKIGPKSILVSLNLAITIDYGSLFVVMPQVHENTTSVEFIFKQLILGNEYTCWDNNISDGCSCDFDGPLGFYEIKAISYNAMGIKIKENSIIAKMFVILL